MNDWSSITFRKAKDSDLNSIGELQNKWKEEEITIGYEIDDPNKLKDKINKIFYLVENREEIIGYLIGEIKIANNINVFDDNETYLNIEDIYIKKKYRKLGIGEKLLNHVLNEIKKNGVERVLVYSSTKDISSIIRFYKKINLKTWYVMMYK